ncbi:MAG: hypothetical protein U0802_17260 [Candidatus Binatia bacterium]
MGRVALVIGLFACGRALPAAAQGAFVNFESGHVRPLALSPDGSLLFAVNTPDNRLEIFNVGAGGLTLATEVSVGLEPVAVASRVNGSRRTEAWVVNHLSADSVSIVEVDPSDVALTRVVRTLLVGDEPRATWCSRGQVQPRLRHHGAARSERPRDGAGEPHHRRHGARALVWAFDASAPGAALGRTPLLDHPVLRRHPAGAGVASGTRVYAAAFQSGNRTTAVNEVW